MEFDIVYFGSGAGVVLAFWWVGMIVHYVFRLSSLLPATFSGRRGR